MTDLRQSKEYALYMKLIGWQVKKNMFIKKMPLVPLIFIKWQRPSKIKKQNFNAHLIKIEPAVLKNSSVEKKLFKMGFKKDGWPMLPTKTIWLDLNKSDYQLLKEMHYKTRYNILKHKTKVQIIKGNNLNRIKLKQFFRIYSQNAKRQSYWGLNFNQLNCWFKAFGGNCYLLLTSNSGLVVSVYYKTAYYCHNGSTENGKKKYEPTALTWQAIKLSRKLGCSKFDFEGIADKRYRVTKKWIGFSRFKKSFGGKEIEYAGSFSKWQWRFN